MISELLALVTGAFLGAVITASVYRGNQASNVRKAIASVRGYLDPDTTKPLGNMTAKLKLHLDVIHEADDLVTRSHWAKRHKNRFVAQSVRIATLRNKGTAKANKRLFDEARETVRESGDRLMGYLDFPSWLWLKATAIRLFEGARSRVAAPKRHRARGASEAPGLTEMPAAPLKR